MPPNLSSRRGHRVPARGSRCGGEPASHCNIGGGKPAGGGGGGGGASRRATATSAGETGQGAVGAPGATALSLRISLLGGFAVSIGERAIPPEAWRLSRARSLIKLLALAPGHRLTRDQLVEYLSPDFPPQTAITNLYSTLNAARHVLAP